MINALRHLLPDSVAWRVVVERTLKRYLRGLATVGGDTVAFVDDIYDDVWPDTTRELEEWEAQFNLDGMGSDASRRQALEAAWATRGGQSPAYLQSILRAAGFDATVYDWWDHADGSLTTYADDVAVSIGSLEPLGDPRGFSFAANGKYLYIAGAVGSSIYQYTLSSPYELSTATYYSSYSVLSQDMTPVDAQVSSDGARMFVLGDATNKVYQYNLASPYDCSSASAVGIQELDISGEETSPKTFAWKFDGSTVCVTGSASESSHQYDLSTPWDITTASLSHSHDWQFPNPVGMSFSDTGEHVFVLPLATGVALQYDLSTPWDISTLPDPSLWSAAIDLTVQDSDPFKIVQTAGMFFMLGIGGNSMFRYVYGGPRDPRDYTNQPKIGTTQCGDDGSNPGTPIAECGEQPPGQTSVESANCNRFLANEIWYLWNDDLTPKAPPPVSGNIDAWMQFWYVGGAPFGTLLDVPAADRARLEKLIYRIAPAHTWVVTLFNIT